MEINRKKYDERYIEWRKRMTKKMQIDHKKVNTLRSFFGVKLRGNETFD